MDSCHGRAESPHLLAKPFLSDGAPQGHQGIKLNTSNNAVGMTFNVIQKYPLYKYTQAMGSPTLIYVHKFLLGFGQNQLYLATFGPKSDIHTMPHPLL